MKLAPTIMICITISMSIACSKSADTSPNSMSNPTSNTAVPEIYKKVYGASSITSDGTYITIKSST